MYKNGKSLGSCLVTILTGILLILAPTSLAASVVQIAGGALVIYGIYLGYCFAKSDYRSGMDLGISLLAIAGGLFMISNAYGLLEAIPTFIGIYLLVTGVCKLAVLPVTAIPDLLLGVILLACGFGVFSFALSLVGVFVLAGGIVDLINVIRYR